jgi:hypothetical protein
MGARLDWRWHVNVLEKEAGRVMAALRRQGFSAKKGEPEVGGMTVQAMKKMKAVGVYVAGEVEEN